MTFYKNVILFHQKKTTLFCKLIKNHSKEDCIFWTLKMIYLHKEWTNFNKWPLILFLLTRSFIWVWYWSGKMYFKNPPRSLPKTDPFSMLLNRIRFEKMWSASAWWNRCVRQGGATMVYADGKSFQFWPPELDKNYPISQYFRNFHEWILRIKKTLFFAKVSLMTRSIWVSYFVWRPIST